MCSKQNKSVLDFMFRILHVFVFFSRTIALNGTKLSELTIEGLLSNAVFSDFQNSA